MMKKDSTPVLRRNKWIEACEFSPLSTQEVLNQVLEKARHTPKAVVVIDLDSTLYEVRPRTQRILSDWATHPGAPDHEIRSHFQSLHPKQVGYSVRDTFEAHGYPADEHPEIFEHVKDYWTERFFSNHYLNHDLAYDGTREFVLDLHRANIDIIYLTGRDEPRMGDGTRSKLIHDGFPIDKKSRVWLKPNKKLEDIEYKQQAAKELQQLGTVIASFENEPKNLAGLYDAVPEAMHIFVDTICSDHPAPVRSGLYRITWPNHFESA